MRRKVAIPSSSSSNLEANLSSQPVLVLNSSSLQPQNQSVTENTGQIGIDEFVEEFLVTQSNHNASSRLSSSGKHLTIVFVSPTRHLLKRLGGNFM